MAANRYKGYSKLGPYCNMGGYPGHSRLIVESNCQAVLAVQDLAFLIDLASKLPETIFVYKGWHHPATDGSPMNDDVQRWGAYSDPIGAARAWVHSTRPYVENIPLEYRNRFYVNISNEFADWENLDKMVAFETEATRLLYLETGIGTAAGNFAVGTPESEGARGQEIHQKLITLWEALIQYHGVYNVHEYFAWRPSVYRGPNQDDALSMGVFIDPEFDQYTRTAWHIGRIERVYANYISHYTPELKVVIGEMGAGAALGGMGIDRYFGGPSNTWRDNVPRLKQLFPDQDPYQMHLNDLIKCDNVYKALPYVIGAFVYTATDIEDSGFNITPILPQFYDYIKSQNT